MAADLPAATAVRRHRIMTVLVVVTVVVLGWMAFPWSDDAAHAIPPTDALSLPGGSARSPQIAVDGAGTATALWYRVVGDQSTVQSATRPAGGTWSDPVNLSASAPAPTGVEAETPPVQLAVNRSGDAVAVWFQANGDDRIIQVANRPAGGGWSAAVDLSAPGGRALAPRVVMADDGMATAVWHRSDSNGTRIQTSSRPPGGSWSVPTDLTTLGGLSRLPRVAVDHDGNVTALWFDLSGAPRIRSAVRPVGDSWQPAVDVSLPGTQGDAQLAASGSGEAIAVWMSYEGSDWVIRGARRSGLDGDWSDADLVSAPQDQTSGSAREPRLGVDADGEATVSWYQDSTAGSYIEAASGTPTGGWSAPVTTSGSHAQWPQIAVDATGRTALVWSSWTGSPLVVQEAFRPTDGAWTSAHTLTASTTSAGSPQVAITPEGHVLAVWLESAGVDAIVRAADFDPLTLPPDPPAGTPTPPSTYLPTPWPSPPGSAPPEAPLAPVLSHVRLTRSTIHVVDSDRSPRATRIRLTSNVDARILVRLKRSEKLEGVAVRARLIRERKAGPSAIRLTSKVGATMLPPGSYRVTVRARNSVGASAPHVLRLRILS